MSEISTATTRDEATPSTPPLHTSQVRFDPRTLYRQPVRTIPEASGDQGSRRRRPLTLLFFFLPTSSLSAVPSCNRPSDTYPTQSRQLRDSDKAA